MEEGGDRGGGLLAVVVVEGMAFRVERRGEGWGGVGGGKRARSERTLE